MLLLGEGSNLFNWMLDSDSYSLSCSVRSKHFEFWILDSGPWIEGVLKRDWDRGIGMACWNRLTACVL